MSTRTVALDKLAPAAAEIGPGPSGKDVAVQSPSALEQAVDAAASRFQNLPVAYNHPTTLPFGKASRFLLSIGSADLAAARGRVAAAGPVATANVRLGDLVRAELSGPDSDVAIRLVGPATKVVTRAANATWTWYVTPKTIHDITLSLAIYNEAETASGPKEIDGPAYETSFVVSSSIWDQLSYYAQQIQPGWAAIAAIGGGIAAVATWMSRAIRKPKEPG